MNDSGEIVDASRPTIRILEHNLIDICDLLGATFSLDGVHVTFSNHSEHGARQWQGRLGDWLVSDGDANWFVVSDAEFGRLRSEPAGDGSAVETHLATAPVAQPRTAGA